MSTVQNTDWLLINRGGTDYKISVADWKASQSKAPDVGTVTLADVAGGARFTSTAFPVSATMVEEGIPASTKGLKAYVEGSLKTQAKSGAITAVGDVPTPHPATYEIRSLDGTRQPDSSLMTPPSWSSLVGSAETPAWGADSAKNSNVNYLLYHFGAPMLVKMWSKNAGSPGTGRFSLWSSQDGVNWHFEKQASGTPAEADNFAAAAPAPYFAITYDNFKVWASDVRMNLSRTTSKHLTFGSATGLAQMAAGDLVTEVTAGGAAGDASGSILEVDPVGLSITLATSAGTWDVGSAVKGPIKAPPGGGATVKLFCKLNNAGVVSDLQSADPGFVNQAATPTKVTFPATLPTGNAPDTDLPAGTTLTVEVKATNTAGTDSAKSNTITPA